jgi:two-component system LytT family response regulator
LSRLLKNKLHHEHTFKTDVEQLKAEVELIKEKIKIQSKELNPLMHKLFFVEVSDQIHFLPLSEIIYLKATKNYTEIVCKNASIILSTKTIKYHEANLSAELFIRVHHSFIINIYHLSFIKKLTDISACMSNGEMIPISSRKKKAVFEQIMQSSIVTKNTLNQ